MKSCKNGPPRQKPSEGDKSGPDSAGRLAVLRAACARAVKREQRTIAKQIAERDEAGRWEWYRQIADSIIAVAHDFPRGTGECTVTNIHTGIRETVRLNTKLDAVGNAQLFYKKAKKGERGQAVAIDKVKKTRSKIASIEWIINTVDGFIKGGEVSEDDIGRLEKQAEELGIIPSMPGRSHPAGQLKRVPYRLYTVGGHEIYVGKNDEQNDELATRVVKPWDIWMHVAQHAGSHVVLRRNKKDEWPPHDVVVRAASLAAWFSKARHASYVEVHVAEGRHVRKPRGYAAGKVVITHETTIRVAPRSPGELFGNAAG